MRSPVGFGAVAQGEGGAGWVALSAGQSSSSGHAMAPLGLPLARSGLHARIAELPDPRTGDPDIGPEGTMKHMAGRKRNSAEDIVRKLRRADELAAEGKTGEEIAADLQVSPATLYNWRRAYGGMDTDAAKELKELREQNARLKRLLAEAELEKDALREVAKGKF